MSENRTSEGILTLVLSFTALMVSFFAGYNVARHPFEDKHEMVSSDTIVIEKWDTIIFEKPTEKIRYVLRYDTIRDTSNTFVVDTTNSASPTIVIPIERTVYKDSTKNAKYEAFISGYKAALDSININCYQTTNIITNTIENQRRIGIGVQVGVGYAGKVTPYIGIGVQYRLW